MIKDRAKWEAFQREELATEQLSYSESLAIFESLRREAVALGAFDSDNSEGLEVALRIARALNGLKKVP